MKSARGQKNENTAFDGYSSDGYFLLCYAHWDPAAPSAADYDLFSALLQTRPVCRAEECLCGKT